MTLPTQAEQEAALATARKMVDWPESFTESQIRSACIVLQTLGTQEDRLDSLKMLRQIDSPEGFSRPSVARHSFEAPNVVKITDIRNAPPRRFNIVWAAIIIIVLIWAISEFTR